MFLAVKARISTIWRSLYPASRTALMSASVRCLRSRTTLAAKCTASFAFASPDSHSRLSVTSSGLILARFRPS